MKRTFSIHSGRPAYLALAVALLMAGCGDKRTASGGGPGGNELAPEFFGGKPTGEITVSAYDTMDYRNFLEEAARAFEAENPGTKINVETFSAMPEIRRSDSGNSLMVMATLQDDPQGRADYTSRVNTNLMSGTGADLYALDVLPLQKFVANGTLENLDPYMAGDPAFNRADYRENILEALRYKDGTWFLPLDYNFEYYAYDGVLVPPEAAAGFGPAQVWTAGELLSQGEKLSNGENRLFNMRPSGLLPLLLAERIGTFADLDLKKANFTDGGFTGLLEGVKRSAEQGYIPSDISGGQDPARRMREAATAPTDRYYFKHYYNSALLSQFTRGLGMRMMIEGGGGGIGSARGITDDDRIVGIAAAPEGRVPFGYNKALGINAQSKNKALAWAFLRSLLSKESQLSTAHSVDGLPLHNGARSEKAELLFSGAFAGRGGQPMNSQTREAMEQYRAAVETLSDRINSFTVRDRAIDDMIQAETRYFLDGSRTSAELARVLQNKVELYLNE